MKVKDYDRNVFINCAFDKPFLEMFRAIVFVVHDCGFIVRCALETGNANGVRIDKIIKIIDLCRYGIHDLSSIAITEESPLPRFNMPYELGVFMGCKHFGENHHKKKDFLVLDSEPHRYKRLISDLAGYDFQAHNDNPATVISIVRDWLSEATSKRLPGAAFYQERYQSFLDNLPALCEQWHTAPEALNFKDYYSLVSVWVLTTNKLTVENEGK